MKKAYDKYINPQNNPNIKLKRLIHILSNSLFVINLIIFSILLPDTRIFSLVLGILFAVHAVLLLLDNRKCEWTWLSIIFFAIIQTAITISYILLFSIYFYFTIICIEIIISVVLIYVLIKV